ncbi:Tetratricopeptide repeat-containing protein [Geodermatophilus africanus]|uniref:Tetratricopeptide repeat-containing protein n=1 Tax=Geodermatophilus africanus TaxID=1137993 RepID=A0A1H3MG94_9ACTN|nr:tetratricopeptide repeat protein [Geodermatophilus africanus]SDY75712.1 Tetratricopeptide repeat-containing protein [Geodermatophilus africanus]
MSGRRTDFFISHAGQDTGWAEWLAWHLQEAGWTVELDVWDWAPGEDVVARRVLGPDHVISLGAAAALTGAFSLVGEAESARALGEDTLERCRRVLGPDHAITLLAAAALTGALVRLGEAEPGRALGEDTLRRCRRVLGLDNPIALTAAAALPGP